MAITRRKNFSHPEFGKVTVQWSDRQRAAFRISEDAIVVTAPCGFSDAQALELLSMYKDKVLDRKRRIESRERILPEDRTELDGLTRRAEAYLPGRLFELADRYGFSVSAVGLNALKHCLGRCFTRSGRIELNVAMMNIPRILSDTVMLHELCHLHHPNHGPGFHRELEELTRRHFEWMTSSYLHKYGTQALCFASGELPMDGLDEDAKADIKELSLMMDITREASAGKSVTPLTRAVNARMHYR